MGFFKKTLMTFGESWIELSLTVLSWIEEFSMDPTTIPTPEPFKLTPVTDEAGDSKHGDGKTSQKTTTGTPGSGIEPGCRVRLKAGFEGVYQSSFPGAEGWVEDMDEEEGFHRVYIHWDQSHNLYNGERDLWTFANHFDVIEGAPDMGDDPADWGNVDDFVEVMEAARDTTEKGIGFLTITLSPHPEDDSVMIPYIFTSALDPEAMLAIQHELLQLCSSILEIQARRK